MYSACLLGTLWARQEKDRLRHGLCSQQAQCTRPACNGWHDLGLVFCQPNGKPLHDNNLRQRDVRRICEKLGLSWRRTLHNLRHAHGSYLIQRGVSVKIVQERLGHSSPAFTLTVYTHVLAGMQEQATRAISEMLRDTKKAARG